MIGTNSYLGRYLSNLFMVRNHAVRDVSEGATRFFFAMGLRVAPAPPSTIVLSRAREMMTFSRGSQ